jgi:hypothetical protein
MIHHSSATHDIWNKLTSWQHHWIKYQNRRVGERRRVEIFFTCIFKSKYLCVHNKYMREAPGQWSHSVNAMHSVFCDKIYSLLYRCTGRLSLQHFSVQFYSLRLRTGGGIHCRKQSVMKQPRVTYDSIGIEVATFSDEKLSIGSCTLYRHAGFFKFF